MERTQPTMFHGGYIGKVLHVDLARKTVQAQPLDGREALGFIGGRGLGALWYSRLQRADVEPLSGDNLLMFLSKSRMPEFREQTKIEHSGTLSVIDLVQKTAAEVNVGSDSDD